MINNNEFITAKEQLMRDFSGGGARIVLDPALIHAKVRDNQNPEREFDESSFWDMVPAATFDGYYVEWNPPAEDSPSHPKNISVTPTEIAAMEKWLAPQLKVHIDRAFIGYTPSPGIYGIICAAVNTATGEMYVVKTKRARDEVAKECFRNAKNPKSKTHISTAIRKHGEDAFVWITLRECPTKEDLFHEKKDYIAAYQQQLGVRHVYNMTDGGKGVSGLRMDKTPKHHQKPPNKRQKKLV